MKKSLSGYVHIPFCRRRCAYCDFSTCSGANDIWELYKRTLLGEIGTISYIGRPLKTVYFGGGTPSVIGAAALVEILDGLREALPLARDAEITVEANPESASEDFFRAAVDGGFNRASLGMQSAHDGELRMLRRPHGAAQTVRAVKAARAAGMDNLSLDLMFGLPGQMLDSWRVSVDAALALQPEHLSLYALTVEDGTPLAAQIARGDLPEPDEDRAADMYEWASERLEAAGFGQYEISSWALPGRECRHNMQYWHNDPYIGLGSGAHGWLDGIRYANAFPPQDYIARVNAGQSPRSEQYRPDREDEIAETMMMGLRLTREGVRDSRFRARFGESFEVLFGETISRLVRDGLLERTPDAIRLTARGRLLGNVVFRAFV